MPGMKKGDEVQRQAKLDKKTALRNNLFFPDEIQFHPVAHLYTTDGNTIPVSKNVY